MNKIYISKELGNVYWVADDFQTLMAYSIDDGPKDLDDDSYEVDLYSFDERFMKDGRSVVDYLKEVKRLLNE